MPLSSPIYRPAALDADSPLRQGELLTNLKQFCLNLETVTAEVPSVVPVTHPYVLVLTQDCDLDQDFKAHQGINQPDKKLPTILFGHVFTAAELRGSAGINSSLWQPIRQNKDERFHFLQRVEPSFDACNEGLPELTIDFKKFFANPRDEIYLRIRIGEVRRRCILVSPYLEHFSSRFAHYLSRVALPEDHFSEPAPTKAPRLLPNSPA